MTWRKSTYSSSGGATCIEVGSDAGKVGVRDTKQAHLGDRRTVLSVTPDAWRNFLDTVK